ncbi:Photosystem II PsbZ, reaction centre [Cynara cardunculus var. scolymus]|uniref:Photosystem II reaction center protein Z n=1 Tax=Cynara cardunculus var. scolymus TaxID=59895 RepID=A0A103Y1J4_CYNCS|nr:Photosystem II PsbZ, reaction centre [Cynara cardunculus var. scolymus]
MTIGVDTVTIKDLGCDGSNGIVHVLVAWRIKSLTLAFQLAVFALIATSSILLISVPVVFASLDGLYIIMDCISLFGGYP